MFQRLAAISCFALAALASSPASAQIIIGGKPVEEEPAITIAPGLAPATSTASSASMFPVDPDASGYAKVSIAAPAFSGASEAETAIAAQVAEVIRADLASVGIFAAPEATAISAITADIGALPAWADWSGASVGALVLGKAVIGADNSLTVQFRLYDVAARKQVVGTQYRLPAADQWRRAAHKVADDVMVALVGGKPGFDTRLTFAGETGGKTQLGLVDSDGANAQATLDSVPALSSPRFSPVTQTIVYSADAPVPGKPSQAQRTTITFDMNSGQRAPLTTGAQPNADVRYSADGLSLIYSRKAGANTDVYLMALSTRRETKLTDDKAVDADPSLSPDGKQYVFVSDRAGATQLYVANVDGSGVRCADGAEAKACAITTEGGGHADPAWSPDGKWIAYARRVGEESTIHLVRPNGSDGRALTNPGVDMFDMHPAWSPDSRRIAFGRIKGSRAHLAITDLTGGQPRRLDTPGDAFEPDWGPKLP